MQNMSVTAKEQHHKTHLLSMVKKKKGIYPGQKLESLLSIGREMPVQKLQAKK